MKQTFQKSPDIIFMDATYKTNKQGFTMNAFLPWMSKDQESRWLMPSTIQKQKIAYHICVTYSSKKRRLGKDKDVYGG